MKLFAERWAQRGRRVIREENTAGPAVALCLSDADAALIAAAPQMARELLRLIDQPWEPVEHGLKGTIALPIEAHMDIVNLLLDAGVLTKEDVR